MPATYEPIATTTVTGSSVADISFTSISGSYTDLIIMGSARSTRTANYGVFSIRLNNDSSSLYSLTRIYSNTAAGTAGSDRNSGTYFEAGQMVSDSSASGIFTPCQIHIMNYANTTTYKTMLANNPNSQDGYGVQPVVALYRSTSAITQVKLFDAYGGNLAVGTTITLYGIKAA